MFGDRFNNQRLLLFVRGTMTEPSPETVELTIAARDAMRADQMEEILHAAGAREVIGKATEVLRETSAAQVASRMTAGAQPPERTQAEPKLFDAAREAFDAEAFQASQGAPPDLDPEEASDHVAHQLAMNAQEAADFARAEGRPVCHNCVAVGATRAQPGTVDVQP